LKRSNSTKNLIKAAKYSAWCCITE